MKKYIVTLLLTLSPLLSCFAETSAIRPDVDELLTVMRMEKTMQSAMEQVKKVIPQMMASMVAQGKISQAEGEKSKAIQEKIFTLVQEEMSWQKRKADFAQIYAESLTPEEVKGITAFYKSPAGQAFLDKQPLIMQKTMVMQQKMMVELMPKIEALVESETKGAAAPAK